MAKQIQTYNGVISENVPWNTGDESTNNLPPSGKSIRDLLQKRIKLPIFMVHDGIERKYRLFSSEENYDLWLLRDEYPEENYAALQLGEFIAPSPYTVSVCEYKDTNAFNASTRFVRSGSNTDDTRLKYSWELLSDDNHEDDSMTVTYTFYNNGELSFSLFYEAGDRHIDFDISQYLKDGLNTITMHFMSTKYKALKTISFVINVINLQINTNFSFYKNKPKASLETVQVLINCSLELNIRLLTYLDGELFIERDIPANTKSFNLPISIPVGLPDGKHKLQVIAYVNINGENFYSNTILYDFCILPTSAGAAFVEHVLLSQNILDVDSKNIILEDFNFIATQYSEITINWGYNNSRGNQEQRSIRWSLINKNNVATILSTITTITGTLAQPLSFIPTTAGKYTLLAEVLNNLGDVTATETYPIKINSSGYDVSEEPGYALKLTAVGKNNRDDKNKWEYGNVTSTFNNFTWDSKSGWNDNSLMIPIGASVDINFTPFAENNQPVATYGRCIEIDFSTSAVSDPNVELARIGGGVGGAYISITANSANLIDSSSATLIKTNFKDSERVRLCFIINPDIPDVGEDRNLVFIVTNGIFERVGQLGLNIGGSGNIHLGVTEGNSGATLQIYSIKCYNNFITIENAFRNWLVDQSNIGLIYNNNLVYNNSNQIDFDKVKAKLDTILITGLLYYFIKTKGYEAEYESASAAGDAAKAYELPVTLQRICPYDASKNLIVLNAKLRRHGQSTLNYPLTSFKLWTNNTWTCWLDLQEYTGSAYIATSIEDCTKANELYKGRYIFKEGAIPAKKFVLQANYADSSGTHNGSLLRLLNDSWYNAKIDGEYKLRTEPQLFASDLTTAEIPFTKTWKDYVLLAWKKKEFPYNIRTAPDSVPCVIFWREDESSSFKFLGQYVLMDDKKSAFTYGERSIYKVENDPFCMLEGNSKNDIDENRIWDNSKVLRMEVLDINNNFADFRSLTDEQGHAFDDIKNNADGNLEYYWENVYELIYPDKDDITSKINGVSKFDPTKFTNKVLPWVDFYKWVVSTYNNHSKFLAEAVDHLDIYKMAAYYIFLMRFGLVDSLERNALWKTYDGQHWHCEPWDMDIALGNRNTGGIAFDPPIDRNTRESENVYAYSGRTRTTSNWLYDALEAWPEFINTIVPKVAQALYEAGLTYYNIINMFDENYQAKWCERIYNISGHFKYIENGGGDYYQWCQGARTTHRHWWLKSSMDYYDAKWGVGDFKNTAIYIAAGKEIENGEDETYQTSGMIKLESLSHTYAAYTINGILLETIELQPNTPNGFDVSTVSFSPKAPMHILGATKFNKLDVSCLAKGISVLNFTNAYSESAGATLKELKIGLGKDKISESNLGNAANISIQGLEYLKNLEILDITGMRSLTGAGGLDDPLYSVLKAIYNLKELHAEGSGMTNFSGIAEGSNYSLLHFPDTVASISMTDSSWNTLDFYDLVHKQYNNFNPNLSLIRFLGSTGSNACAIDFVLNWILYLEENNLPLSDKVLQLESINATNGEFTYDTLIKLALFNGGDNVNKNFTGYILLRAGEEMDTDKMLALLLAFGDSIFTKNSGGLVIDWEQEEIFITIGGPISGNASHIFVLNGELWIEEGYELDKITPKTALLRATKFMLVDRDREQTWSIRDDSLGLTIEEGLDYYGCYIGRNAGIPYLFVPDMRPDYVTHLIPDLIHILVIDNETSQVGDLIVHIKHHAYPSSLSINLVDSSSKPLLLYGDFAIISMPGTTRGLANLEYTNNTDTKVQIDRIEWQYSNIPFGMIVLVNGSNEKECNISYVNSLSEEEIIFDFGYTVIYTNGYLDVVLKLIIIVKDTIILTSSNNPQLYLAFRDLGYPMYNYNYTKYALKGIPNLYLGPDNTYANTITSFRTQDDNEYEIETFLESAKTFDISGTDGSFTKFGTDEELFDFVEKKSLQSINTEGTLANVIATDCTKLTSVKAGKPKIVDLTGSEKVTEVSVQDGSELTTLRVSNPNTTGFMKVLVGIILSQLTEE